MIAVLAGEKGWGVKPFATTAKKMVFFTCLIP